MRPYRRRSCAPDDNSPSTKLRTIEYRENIGRLIAGFVLLAIGAGAFFIDFDPRQIRIRRPYKEIDSTFVIGGAFEHGGETVDAAHQGDDLAADGFAFLPQFQGYRSAGVNRQRIVDRNDFGYVIAAERAVKALEVPRRGDGGIFECGKCALGDSDGDHLGTIALLNRARLLRVGLEQPILLRRERGEMNIP